MKTETGRFSRYLTKKPSVSVSKDKKSGLYYARFVLDKKYAKPTGVRDDGDRDTLKKAQKVAEKIRDKVWKDWLDKAKAGEIDSPPGPPFCSRRS